MVFNAFGMFKIKICGATSVADATAIADAGADAIGLNFFEGSKRYIDPSDARPMCADLSACVKRVGVFVNASTATIRQIASTVALDFVQLHGDEPPDAIADLKGLAVIRAFRCRDGLEPVGAYLQKCTRLPVAVLLDAYDPQEFGGTGKTLHWPDLVQAEHYIGRIPLVLAGGLTPNNVDEAIRLAKPFGVDVASGVEISPGTKDTEKCRAFVKSAKLAFSE